MSAHPPFQCLRPESLSPIVLICEHAGNALPDGIVPGAAEEALLQTHWGWDPGAWELTRELSEALDAGAVGGRWSRLWTDLNRRIDDPTLARSHAGEQPVPWNQDLTPEDLEARIDAVHTPYHVEVDRLVSRRVLRGVQPLIFSIHTFTDQLGEEVRGFEIGVLFNDHPELAYRLGKDIERLGRSTRYNEPYSGVEEMIYAAERHGRHYRLPFLELEVNQKYFEDPAYAQGLARDMADPLKNLVTHLGAAGG